MSIFIAKHVLGPCPFLASNLLPQHVQDLNFQNDRATLTLQVIDTSGALVIATPDLAHKTFGEASTKVFNDWNGIEEILSVPDWAPHRSADRIVIEASMGNVKTAIVCPPTIYGQGRGPSNQRSHQIPDMARCKCILVATFFWAVMAKNRHDYVLCCSSASERAESFTSGFTKRS